MGKHAAVADLHHEGLKEGSAKSQCARILDTKVVECSILLLVFLDIILLSIEAGIDHHLLCIDGQVVPGPAGLSQPHHALLQRSWGPLGWAIAPMISAEADAASEAVPKTSTGTGDIVVPEKEPPDEDFGTLSTRVKGTVLHVKHKHSLANEPVSDDPKGMKVIDNIHSPKGPDRKNLEHLDKDEHKETQHKEVMHHKHAGHHRGTSDDGGHSEHGAHGHSSSRVLMCETRDGHHAEHIAHNCHLASICILCIFLLEITLKVWIDPVGFWHNKFLVLDFMVILVSLLTDTIIMWWVQMHEPSRAKELATIAAALLFVRCWRVIRIAHGLAEHVHHEHEKELATEEITHRSEQLEAELKAAQRELRSVRGY